VTNFLRLIHKHGSLGDEHHHDRKNDHVDFFKTFKQRVVTFRGWDVENACSHVICDAGLCEDKSIFYKNDEIKERSVKCNINCRIGKLDEV
jgi:hypothetical protein